MSVGLQSLTADSPYRCSQDGARLPSGCAAGRTAALPWDSALSSSRSPGAAGTAGAAPRPGFCISNRLPGCRAPTTPGTAGCRTHLPAGVPAQVISPPPPGQLLPSPCPQEHLPERSQQQGGFSEDGLAGREGLGPEATHALQP